MISVLSLVITPTGWRYYLGLQSLKKEKSAHPEVTSSENFSVVIPGLPYCKLSQNPLVPIILGISWGLDNGRAAMDWDLFPLYHPSALLHPSAHADVHPPLTFRHSEGWFHLAKTISEVTLCQPYSRGAGNAQVKPLGLLQGKAKKPPKVSSN